MILYKGMFSKRFYHKYNKGHHRLTGLKIILPVLLLVLLSACGLKPEENKLIDYTKWPMDAYLISPEGSAEGNVVRVKGEVIENDFGCEVDGLCFLILNVDGYKVKVIYHYGEYPPCINEYAVEQGFEVSEGDKVEVVAGIFEQYYLTTCDSPDFYIQPVPK